MIGQFLQIDSLIVLGGQELKCHVYVARVIAQQLGPRPYMRVTDVELCDPVLSLGVQASEA